MYNLDAPIKGYDQAELATMLGAEFSDDPDDDMSAIRQGLDKLWETFLPWGEHTLADREAVEWIRRWLNKLAEEDNGYLAPFFLGIAAIEDAQMLIQVVEKNLGLLWT